MEIVSILFSDDEQEAYDYIMSQSQGHPAKWLKERVRSRMNFDRMVKHE